LLPWLHVNMQQTECSKQNAANRMQQTECISP